MTQLGFDYSIILAHDSKHFAIGLNDNGSYSIPWKSSLDMSYFRAVTVNKIVIMGHNTFKSLKMNQGLSNRINIVLTSQSYEQTESFRTAGSIQDVQAILQQYKHIEVFVIGGSCVYQQFLNPYPEQCKSIYITRVTCDLSKYAESQLITYTPLIPDHLRLSFISRPIRDKDLILDFLVYGDGLVPKSLNIQPSQEQQYIDLVNRVNEQGYSSIDRTKVGTKSLFGEQLRFDLKDSFPLLTTKKTFFRGIVEELLWFIRGQTDAKILDTKGIKIWNQNAQSKCQDATTDSMDCGPIYGFQFRHSGANYINCNTDYQGQGVDQLQELIKGLRDDPFSRRHIICPWNPKDLKQMCLTPCHALVQFNVNDKYELSCHMYQRSADLLLGVPFNIASYALFTYILAHHLGYKVGELIMSFGNVHIYNNHNDGLAILLDRIPYTFPQLQLNYDPNTKPEDIQFKDMQLIEYKSHPAISLPMAV